MRPVLEFAFRHPARTFPIRRPQPGQNVYTLQLRLFSRSFRRCLKS
jgi:hypothetical protein